MNTKNEFPRFLPLLLGLPLLPIVASADDVVRGEVLCAETAFSRAAEARNLSLFLSFIDPDARFANTSVARGKNEIAESWRVFFEEGGPAIRWRAIITEVSSDGRLALSRGPYRTIRTGQDGQTTESWGHFISTWRKGDDGRWLVLFDSGGDAGMTPSADEVVVLNADPDCP